VSFLNDSNDASRQSVAEHHLPNGTGDSVTSKLLDGLTILVLEDEFLIAMDVEHLCLEHGAAAVAIAGNLAEVPAAFDFDAAIIDLMVAGHSTLDFAGELKKRGVPFVFASGYGDREALMLRFPGVSVVTKPYAGNDLIEALADAYRRGREPELA
jgi:DNA-binding response OmpR family regulator